jgi:hypothetical protein
METLKQVQSILEAQAAITDVDASKSSRLDRFSCPCNSNGISTITEAMQYEPSTLQTKTLVLLIEQQTATTTAYHPSAKSNESHRGPSPQPRRV